MGKHFSKNKEPNWFHACYEAEQLCQSKNGIVSNEDIFKIARKFGVDEKEILEETQYGQRLENANLMAIEALKNIASQYDVELRDLESRLEEFWLKYEDNFDLAFYKAIDLVENDSFEIFEEDMLKIAEEFGVDAGRLMEEVNQALYDITEDEDEDKEDKVKSSR
jgi:transcriptional regulator with XRE-family HTH domain